MFVLLLLPLIMGLLLIIGAIYNIYSSGFTDVALMGIIVGLVFNLVAAFWGIEYGKNVGK